MIKIARGKSGQTEAKMKSWNVIDDRKKEVKPTQRKKTRERKDERYLERERDETRATRKNHQMSIKVAQKWFDFTRKMIDFDTFTKLPKNVVDLGKLFFAKGIKNLPKVQ